MHCKKCQKCGTPNSNSRTCPTHQYGGRGNNIVTIKFKVHVQRDEDSKLLRYKDDLVPFILNVYKNAYERNAEVYPALNTATITYLGRRTFEGRAIGLDPDYAEFLSDPQTETEVEIEGKNYIIYGEPIYDE